MFLLVEMSRVGHKLLSKIFDQLYREQSPFLTHEILQFIQRNPKLQAINSDIVRNEGYQKSIQEENTNNG